MALTDISGIGSKTAEKLEQEGITTERELAEARRRGDPSLEKFGKRVNDGAIDAALKFFGAYDDPFLGVRVSKENRSQIEALSSRETSDLTDSGKVTQRRSSLQGISLLELGRKATTGAELTQELGGPPTQDEVQDTIVTPNPSGPLEVQDREDKRRMQIERNFAEMGFDVAANIANVDRETIEEANQRRRKATPAGRKNKRQGVSTAFERTVERDIAGETKEFDEEVRAKPVEYAAAQRIHQARSPMAKRVDNRREAETVTGDFEEWKEDPSQVDYPGVDTPQKGAQAGDAFGFTANDTEVEVDIDPRGDGFNVKETSTDGGGGFGRIERLGGEILSAPQEQQRLILNDLLPGEEEVDELDLEIRGPDRELFFGDAEGDFL